MIAQALTFKKCTVVSFQSVFTKLAEILAALALLVQILKTRLRQEGNPPSPHLQK